MTSDREYAEEILRLAEKDYPSQYHLQLPCARRLLAALEREEKLREALVMIRELPFPQRNPDGDEQYVETIRLIAEDGLEPHGNFFDTQDTNPEGGC